MLLLLSTALLSLHGCATVFGDNVRTINVQSKPPEAEVYIDGQRRGTTPITITLPNDIYGGKSVVIKKEGYHDETMMINTKFQLCGLLDVFFWPTFIIDGVTGNLVKIDPAHRNLCAELRALKSECTAPAKESK